MNKKLLIIADDFTGALDSGVQFASKGANTVAVTNPCYDISEIKDRNYDVLVINADSRHLSPQDAYAVVFNISKAAIQNGFDYIFKKTDSALRGNVGAELLALHKASGQSVVFLPAYPKQNRITKDGIQYINGKPVAESVFAEDLFNPVTKSAISEILNIGKSNVAIHAVNDASIDKSKAVNVYDSETNEEMKDIAVCLGEDNLKCCAGCAGFAEILSDLLGYEQQAGSTEIISSNLLLTCGSMNPITLSQMDYAERIGYRRVSLRPEEKLDEACLKRNSDRINIMAGIVKENGCLIIDANDPNGGTQTAEYAKSRNITPEIMRESIVRNTAVFAKGVIDSGEQCTLCCTGGDTLKAMMNVLSVPLIKPLKELFPGVVLSEFSYTGKTYQVISKSGGFGPEDLIEKIMQAIQSEKGVKANA